MQFIIAIFLIGLSLTLFAVAGSMLARTRDGASSMKPGAERRPVTTEVMRPNPAFWLAGAVLMAAGVGVAVAGVGQLIDTSNLPDPFHGRGAEAFADAVSTVFWGVFILTIGAYVWRGARRRGWKDRFGRLVIIAGYLLIGIATSEMWHVAVGLWSASEAQGDQVLTATLVTFLAWGVPGALLVRVGTWLAREVVITEVTVNVDF